MTNNFTLPLLCVLFIFTIRIANGQIKNQIIKSEQAPKHGVMFDRVNNLASHELPNINVRQLLKEDSVEQTQGKPFRFGKAIDVNIDFLKVATKINNGDTTLFFYKIISKNAFSINLIFNDFFLTNNASLLIYNSDRSMVYGPIINQNNPTNRIFWTDLVKGESIVIQLTLIGEDTKETRIQIEKVIHGYQNTFAGFGESANCNRDIACEEGNAWRDEGNSVAMLLLANGQRFCSGVLLNNACQDFTPNLLTAFHCLDANQNGVLAEAERNEVNNWVFRFLYESPSCGGGDGTTFQSINGSAFRSAFQPSDFALLLLNTRPTGNVTYAGWSRTNAAATSAVAIHHPNGDVKKISIDNDALTNVAVTTTWARDIFGNPIVQCPPNTHWQAIFDSPGAGIAASTVQPGSSGSPIFDQDHRVVGQLHGDFLNSDNNFCANRRGHYGRFDVSWGGGGTTATQLSVWLTNDPNVLQVNTLRIPNVVSTNLICNNETFTVQNQPPNSTITWTSSNPNGLSINSTTGAATRQNGFNGQVTITANILSQGPCNPVIFTRTVWVGTPTISVPTIYGPCYERVYSYSAPFVTGVNYTWTINNTNLTASGNNNFCEVSGPSPVYGGNPFTITVTMQQNGCSVSFTKCCQSYKQKTQEQCSGGGNPLRIYPNPAKEELSVEIIDENLEGTEPVFSYTLLNLNNQVKRSGENNIEKVTIDTRSLPKGVYVLKIIFSGEIFEERIVIEK